MKVNVQAGDVELVVTHLPDCRCDLATPDPEATLVQLGCVTGYRVSLAMIQSPGTVVEEDSPLIKYGGDARGGCWLLVRW